MPTTSHHPADIYAGAKIKEFRALKNKSQETLAKEIGVTFQQLQKYETGANRISVSRLESIANALKAPIASFFRTDDGATSDYYANVKKLITLLTAFESIKTIITSTDNKLK